MAKTSSAKSVEGNNPRKRNRRTKRFHCNRFLTTLECLDKNVRTKFKNTRNKKNFKKRILMGKKSMHVFHIDPVKFGVTDKNLHLDSSSEVSRPSTPTKKLKLTRKTVNQTFRILESLYSSLDDREESLSSTSSHSMNLNLVVQNFANKKRKIDQNKLKNKRQTVRTPTPYPRVLRKRRRQDSDSSVGSSNESNRSKSKPKELEEIYNVNERGLTDERLMYFSNGQLESGSSGTNSETERSEGCEKLFQNSELNVPIKEVDNIIIKPENYSEEN